MNRDLLRSSNRLLLWGALLNSLAVPLPFLLFVEDFNIDGVTDELVAAIFWCFALGPIVAGLVLCAVLRHFEAPRPAQRAMLCYACVCSLVPLGLTLLQLFFLNPDGILPLSASVLYVSYASVPLLVGVLVVWFVTARSARKRG